MDTEIADLLADLSHKFKNRLRTSCGHAELNLSPFQAKALAFIGRNRGAPQHLLTEHSGRDKAQIARVLKELEGRGLIARHPDPEDGRVWRLDLSEEGAGIYDQLRARRAIIAAAMLDGIGQEERESLKRALDKMRGNLV